MSPFKRVLTTLGVAAGIAAGAAAAGYAGERALLKSLRTRPDPDEGLLGLLEVDDTYRLPTHDEGVAYAVSRGDGPPIVLAHGVTISSRAWVKQFQELPAAGVRVIAFDHRGHGDSVVGTTGHSVDNLATDLRTILEALDLRGAVLVGHSMGGVAAQAFALNHPDVLRERVAGLVLLSTLAKTSVSASRRLRCLAERVTGSVDVGRLASRPDLGTLVARVGFGRQPLPSHVELNRQMLAGCDSTTGREATGVLLGLDLTAALPSLDIPTLVIGGTADVITPPAESRRLAALIPGAQLELLAGAGHMIMLERTATFHHLLLDFAGAVGALPAAAGAA